jgi:hypothetical protein
MKRIKRICTHSRHWLWYGVSGLSTIAGALASIISPDVHPYGFVGVTVLAGGAGIMAQVSRPKDLGDGD